MNNLAVENSIFFNIQNLKIFEFFKLKKKKFNSWKLMKIEVSSILKWREWKKSGNLTAEIEENSKLNKKNSRKLNS